LGNHAANAAQGVSKLGGRRESHSRILSNRFDGDGYCSGVPLTTILIECLVWALHQCDPKEATENIRKSTGVSEDHTVMRSRST
jgi:hypothetical protein